MPKTLPSIVADIKAGIARCPSDKTVVVVLNGIHNGRQVISNLREDYLVLANCDNYEFFMTAPCRGVTLYNCKDCNIYYRYPRRDWHTAEDMGSSGCNFHAW